MYNVELDFSFLFLSIIDKNTRDIISLKINDFEKEFNLTSKIGYNKNLTITEEQLFYMKLKYPEFIESVKEINNE